MMQKVVVGLLVVTVIGAVGVGLYDASRSDTTPAQARVLANPELDANAAVAADPAAQSQQIGPTPTVEVADGAVVTDPTVVSTTADAALSTPAQEQAATDMVGDVWSASGTIAALESAGMTLTLADGSQVYVELGPSSYWSAQGVTLAVGDLVSLDGFYNGEQYHAALVTTADGAEIRVRTETGQPLWSGGSSGGQSQNGAVNGAANGTTTEAQVSADEWITVEGTVTAVAASTLTMQTTTGETLELQLGQASFMAQQGVTFAAGDEISVVGFWQGTEFRAGDITNTATGERLMLLDPNGRPLWGGPGRSGSSNGQGNSGSTGNSGNSGNGQGNSGNSGNSSNSGNGQGNSGNSGKGGNGQGAQGNSGNSGQGNGAQGQGQGGQGQGQQSQSQGVPADEWVTIEGDVRQTEQLALTIALQDGEQVRVVLGQTDFWSAQSIWFSYGDQLTIDGFWQNGQFEAGTVTFTATGEQLAIRDTATGQLLWPANTQSGQGQGGNGGSGNGYRGGR